ncbi:hypothetical protein [Occallatibacter savannae]|uniref:hypothetical protein n=1 Tax=Occallatibacter savannae TaxID=1002691 RepID=UPI000D689CDF|nr:hypothetical protein [Occallatibacter savannae]
MVRNLPYTGDISTKCELWKERLLSVGSDKRLPAFDLYQGDYWANIRRMVGAVQTKSCIDVRLWIASAGCGLICPSTLIPPYSATFAPYGADTVSSEIGELRQWWKLLSSIRIGNEAHRSISGLASEDPESLLLVTGSPAYLQAMADDLQQAVSKIRHGANLTILCRRGALPGELEQFKVHLTANMRSVVGGALISLSARVLAWLVCNHPLALNRPGIETALRQLNMDSGEFVVPKRKRATDEEIKDFISDRIEEDIRVSRSSVLTAFRRSGNAAEEKRFQMLFREVKEKVNVA